MIKYYVNDTAQANGNHEVHKQDCNLLAFMLSKTDLGNHASCHLAIAEARKIYSQSSACVRCFKKCAVHEM
ncbi:hypothetical protein D9O36_00300 [Zobellia amurskyensis]|uniref:Uncharacterized protein n=1 Tax=Zobellia amurskyensis TaxID=248905 RepID=A0A7X2ZQ01_9FLAO|nr:hypothetical protein [Zobellia amurskyensis]